MRPLPQPEVVLARQQPVAEKHPQLVVERTLVIVARVVLQDMTDVVRVRDEIAAPRTDLEVGDVAEAAGGLHEHAGRIAPDGRQHAKERHSPGSGGSARGEGFAVIARGRCASEARARFAAAHGAAMPPPVDVTKINGIGAKVGAGVCANRTPAIRTARKPDTQLVAGLDPWHVLSRSDLARAVRSRRGHASERDHHGASIGTNRLARWTLWRASCQVPGGRSQRVGIHPDVGDPSETVQPRAPATVSAMPRRRLTRRCCRSFACLFSCPSCRAPSGRRRSAPWTRPAPPGSP